MRPLLILLTLLTLTFPTYAQDAPECDTYTADELSTGARNLRNLNERIGDLDELMLEITSGDGVTEDSILRLMEWAVFADSAMLRFGEEVPACGDYLTAQDTFKDVVSGVYMTSAITHVILQTPAGFARDNMLTLVDTRMRQTLISVEVWRVVYGRVGEG